MKEDFKNIDGVVHGLDPGQFEFGERYVICRRCKSLRRPQSLVFAYGVPVCADHNMVPNGEMPKMQPLVQSPERVRVQAGSARTYVNSDDAPVCPTCGDITVRSGACHKCPNCGETTGCS